MTLAGLQIDQQGDGPPVVFTHGFASSGATWRHQSAALATDMRVVTWDLRGHGASPAPPGDYTQNDGLADLAAVVDAAVAIAGRPALLVGHSLGGYLSLAHALTHPDTVAGLALLSTGPGFRNPQKRAAYNRTMEKVAQRVGFSPSVTQVVIQRDSTVIDGLAEIACPTVVIVGAADLPMYVGGSRYIGERVPGAEFVEVAGAGHDPHLDRADEVTGVLRRIAARSWCT